MWILEISLFRGFKVDIKCIIYRDFIEIYIVGRSMLNLDCWYIIEICDCRKLGKVVKSDGLIRSEFCLCGIG